MKKMLRKDLYKLIPFGIASGLVLLHVLHTKLRTPYVNIYGEEMRYLIVDSVLYAGFGLAIVATLILVNQPKWKYAFVVVAFLATTSVISFFHHTFLIRIGGIRFEFVAAGILLCHLVLNPEVFDPLKALFKSGPESAEAERARYEASVKNFEVNLRWKSTDELKRIVAENELVPEAVEAARRLLQRP